MIDKLSILGIRSFDYKQGSTIQFLAPLTLIVGYNGAGKTTIIECLKYATTGDLPTNSKTSGAFIHDPALNNEREMFAQVKLSFKSTAGARMVVTRSLQLSVKKSQRQQKTLETILLMSRAGERTTISSRAAELDKILPQYLGVSKSVLEYVIFCHQEDSLWPLSDSSSLKKRFDDIFEATRYTKAIENIAILRKKQKAELEKKRILAQHAKEDKDRGARAEKRAEQLSSETDELRDKAMQIEADRKKAVDEADAAWSKYSKFATIVGKLETSRREAKSLESHLQDLREHMKEMEDSDERLQDILDQYEERMRQLKQESGEIMQSYSGLQRDVESNRKEMGIKQAEVGRYQAQRDTFERQVKNRAELIKDTARRHSIRGFDLEVTDEHVRDFMERISRMARDQNRAFEKARQESQEETQNAQRILNEIQARKASLNQDKESARSQIPNNDKKITALQASLDAISVDEGSMSLLQTTLNDVNQRLEKHKTSFGSANWDAQVSSSNEKLRQLEEQHTRLNAELVQGTKHAGDTARLEFLHKELVDRQKSLDTMTGAHGSKISRVVGDEWTPATIERGYTDVLEHKKLEARDAENQRDGVSRELELLESKMIATKDEIKRQQKIKQDAEKKVKDVIETEAEDYPEILRDLEANNNAMGADAASQGALLNFYKDSLNIADQHGACKLCMRAWKNDKEKTTFKTNLEKKLKAIVDQEFAKEAEQTKEDLANVRNLRSDYDAWLRLKNVEIPAMQKELHDLEAKRAEVLGEIERREAIVSECQGSKRDVEALQKTVQNISKYRTDIDAFKAQIADMEGKQNVGGDYRALAQIQSDLETVNDQSRRAKMAHQQLVDERDQTKATITSLELESRDVQSKFSSANYQLKEKSSLQTQVEDLKTSTNEQRESMRRIDSSLQDIAPQIAQAQETYDDACRRGDQRVREMQQEAAKVSESLSELKTFEKEINTYLDRGGPQQLATSKREVEHLEGEISQLEQEKMRITADIKKIEDQLRNQDETRRAINDNLRFRRTKKELDAVRVEIMELEAQDAEKDKVKWEREAQKWDGKRALLAAEAASTVGVIRTKDEQLNEILKDWETDYKDAAEKYRRANIEVETTRHVVDDLGKYSGALDKAIMKFHSLKMEEVNRIIEELWRKTYQGTDVDAIMIRSDNETNKGNRTYNYRVCMVKGDAEMDMRGRCSAGQKVLASIIIRLALAECFGVNCGIIALDEPTTNLDRDNIRALAESLSEIIRIRRRQANFQLIVITHDEEFLRMMNVADFVDNYYRVSRDSNMQSMIEKQSIGEVMV